MNCHKLSGFLKFKLARNITTLQKFKTHTHISLHVCRHTINVNVSIMTHVFQPSLKQTLAFKFLAKHSLTLGASIWHAFKETYLSRSQFLGQRTSPSICPWTTLWHLSPP